jgi:hypothetical protein
MAGRRSAKGEVSGGQELKASAEQDVRITLG